MAARQLYGLVWELLNCQWSFPIIPYHQCSNPLGHWLDEFGYSSSVLSPLQYFIDIVTCEYCKDTLERDINKHIIKDCKIVMNTWYVAAKKKCISKKLKIIKEERYTKQSWESSQPKLTKTIFRETVYDIIYYSWSQYRS